MYFVNQKQHVVSSTIIEASDVCNCEVFSDFEALQTAYPAIKNASFAEIPMVHFKNGNRSREEYYVSSNTINSDFICLDTLETIEDWIETQSETFHTELGVLF